LIQWVILSISKDGKCLLTKIFFYNQFPICENSEGMQIPEAQLAQTVLDALRKQVPVKDLPGVRIAQVRQEPERPFDLSFELTSGENRILVLGEIKQAPSPKVLAEIGPWIQRMKSLKADAAFAVVVPALSPQAQAYCVANGIDFLDLAGNVSIQVPGKFTLQRLGRRSPERNQPADSTRSMNVFSGRSSRVLRVLLEKPKVWSLTDIAKELAAEGKRVQQILRQPMEFAISQGSISKALSSLEEQLWIRRQGSAVLVPEPRRLLVEWAEKYKERYRWRLRSSFELPNPFGRGVSKINEQLKEELDGAYAFTAAAAASLVAPFVELDRVDIFLGSEEGGARLRQLADRESTGPNLRLIFPYDNGVFLYSMREGGVPIVSNLQTYLDLYARGGRDFKQADYLLRNAIEPRWRDA
jgi:DNA-binding HxlR family transcriptional regulator